MAVKVNEHHDDQNDVYIFIYHGIFGPTDFARESSQRRICSFGVSFISYQRRFPLVQVLRRGETFAMQGQSPSDPADVVSSDSLESPSDPADVVSSDSLESDNGGGK